MFGTPLPPDSVAAQRNCAGLHCCRPARAGGTVSMHDAPSGSLAPQKFSDASVGEACPPACPHLPPVPVYGRSGCAKDRGAIGGEANMGVVPQSISATRRALRMTTGQRSRPRSMRWSSSARRAGAAPGSRRRVAGRQGSGRSLLAAADSGGILDMATSELTPPGQDGVSGSIGLSRLAVSGVPLRSLCERPTVGKHALYLQADLAEMLAAFLMGEGVDDVGERKAAVDDRCQAHGL